MVGLCTGYGGDILLKGRGGFRILKKISHRENIFISCKIAGQGN